MLFIGESPPTEPTFFYQGNSILYRATREAFIGALPRLAREQDFLAAFQRMGCFLEDLSREPIDKLPPGDKPHARREAASGLARRLKGLTPRLIVVVLMSIEADVALAAQSAGLGDVPLLALPFPVSYHRTRYKDELTRLIIKWHKRGILMPAR